MSTGSARTAVLVHGGFVDGSGWQGVHDALTADGFRVAVVISAAFCAAGGVLAALTIQNPSHHIAEANDSHCALEAPPLRS